MVEKTEFFSGTALRGESFSPEEEAAWYAEEAEAYRDLSHEDSVSGEVYPYHYQNHLLGFRHLPTGGLGHMVGIGSAHGAEFQPIAHRLSELTVIESDERYFSSVLYGVPCTYRTPSSDGRMPLDDGCADVVTCLGVLHHIARVSVAISEIARVLKPGGYALVREPIISMGDWRQPRRGLTKNERGIPLKMMRSFLEGSGLIVRRQNLLSHALFGKVRSRLGAFGDSQAMTRADVLLSNLYSDVRYHRETAFQKMTPTSAFFVAQKKP